MLRLFIVASFLMSAPGHSAPDSLIPIKIGVADSYSVVDSIAIERLKNAYEAAFYYAIGENAKELQACGYKIQTTVKYYDVADRFAPRERAAQLERGNAWIILGPRRSDQFVLASMGVEKTPIVSMGATSRAAHALQPPFFTMAPHVDDTARVLIAALRREKFGTTYGSVVDVTCSPCREFADAFFEETKNSFQRKFALEIAGDKPEMAKVFAHVAEHQPNFILLPNYFRGAGYVISELQHRFPSLRYVGSDSWGDGNFNFSEEFKIAPHVFGMTVRPGLSAEQMSARLGVSSLDREWSGEVIGPPLMSYRAIEFVRTLRTELCSLWKTQGKRITTKEEFLKLAKTWKKNQFQRHVYLGIYKLQQAHLQFAYEGIAE